MNKLKFVSVILLIFTSFSCWAMEQNRALRLAAVATALSRDLTTQRLPQIPILLATADTLIKKGVSEAEVKEWLINTEIYIQKTRDQLKIFDNSRVAFFNDSSNLIHNLTQQPQFKYSAELIAAANQIGAIRINSFELCKVQQCDPRVLIATPQFSEQVRDIAHRLDNSDVLRRVSENLFNEKGLTELSEMINNYKKVNKSLEAFANNSYVETLLSDMPKDGKLFLEISKRFTNIFETYNSDVINVVESTNDRFQRIDDIETGLQFAGHLASYFEPKLGSTINQIADAWTQVERAKSAFNATSNMTNALAMTNSYLFAANLGISLLSGGNPLGGENSEQATMDAMKKYFEAVFQAMQRMTEHMDKRFDAIDNRLDGISKKLIDIQNQLVTIQYKLDQVATTANVIYENILDIHQRIDVLESLIVGSAQLVVDFSYMKEKRKCFKQVGVNLNADIDGCISLFSTYAINHANKLFTLNSLNEGQASAFDQYFRSTDNELLRSALNETGYDLETLIEGASSYTDYAIILLNSSKGASSIYKMDILRDLQSLKSALLSRQLVFRSFLWETFSALRISAPTQSSLPDATIASKLRDFNDVYEKLSVDRLFEGYIKIAPEIAKARPETYEKFHNYSNSSEFRQSMYAFCAPVNPLSELTPAIHQQFRKEMLDRFITLYESTLKLKSQHAKIVGDMLVDGYAESLLRLDATKDGRLNDFVFSSASPMGLAHQIEKYADEIICKQFVLDDWYKWNKVGRITFKARFSALINELLPSLGNMHPFEIDSLQFRDRRIGPLLRRIDSVRSYLELTTS